MDKAQRTTKMPKGKRRLMEAGARLAANNDSSDGISLRELAREAGLTHNAFYRHFDTVEHLMQVLTEELVRELRLGLAAARQRAGSLPAMTGEVMAFLFDFCLEHPDLFIVAVRGRYGPHSQRSALFERALQEIEDDMVRDYMDMDLLRSVDVRTLRIGVRLLVENAVQKCMVLTRNPAQKPALLAQAQSAFDLVIEGLIACGNQPESIDE